MSVDVCAPTVEGCGDADDTAMMGSGTHPWRLHLCAPWRNADDGDQHEQKRC